MALLFHHQMKHLEVRQEYSAGSSGDETLRLRLDKLHNIKDTHLRIVSVEYSGTSI